MAIKMIAQRFDDLDETLEADETVQFSFDGESYEIDLAADNATEMRDWLKNYANHGRPLRGKNRRGPARKNSTIRRQVPAAEPEETNAAIREWARAQGTEINDRGRIPEAVRAAYRKAQQH